MKAATIYRYGSPDVLQVEELPRPKPKNGEVLIQVASSTVNSGDCRLRKADPFLVRLFFGLFKPRIRVLGSAFSGIIVEKGDEVTRFSVGDAVFGLSDQAFGAHAEYLCFPENGPMAIKPDSLLHPEAAGLVFGGHTALHFLRKAGLKANQHIMIYGASGAVGTSALQLARHFGARVTGVCSSSNVEMVRKLGAEEVIDYTKQDFSSMDACFDMIFETVNKSSVRDMARLIAPGGVLILGAAMIKGMLQGSWVSLTRGIKVVGGVAKTSAQDMEFLADLAVKGALKPVIDRTYPLSDIQAAHEYVDGGHKKGNVVVQIKVDNGG